MKQYLLDHSPGFWLSLSRDHKLIDWQKKLALKLKYHRWRSHIGEDFKFLLPEELGKIHHNYVERWFQKPFNTTLVSRANTPFALKDADGVLHQCMVTIMPFEDTFCDGMCFAAYPDALDVALAHVLFLDDFGQAGSDLSLGAKLRELDLMSAVQAMIKARVAKDAEAAARVGITATDADLAAKGWGDNKQTKTKAKK